jgi:hypothetical protein
LPNHAMTPVTVKGIRIHHPLGLAVWIAFCLPPSGRSTIGMSLHGHRGVIQMQLSKPIMDMPFRNRHAFLQRSAERQAGGDCASEHATRSPHFRAKARRLEGMRRDVAPEQNIDAAVSPRVAAFDQHRAGAGIEQAPGLCHDRFLVFGLWRADEHGKFRQIGSRKLADWHQIPPEGLDEIRFGEHGA